MATEARTRRRRVFWICGVALVWLGVVACGAAATATPVPKAPAPEAPKSRAAPAAPVAQATATPVPAAKSAPTPAPLTAPAVSPGKLTVMTPGFGSERYDAIISSPNAYYARPFHASLIAAELKEGKLIMAPGIATGWKLSSDGKTTTYTIRKGVKFHNGTEVTVEDVLWTLRHTFGPQAVDYINASYALSYAKIMDRIEQTGPDEVSVTMKSPSPDFAAYVSEPGPAGFAGVVMPKRATLHNLEEAAAYDRNPIGTGILKFVKHVPGSQILLERFDDHYYQPKNGLPIDKRVNFRLYDLRLVPDEATRVVALRAGEVDVAPVSLGARKQIEAGGGRLVFGAEGVGFEISLYGCWKPQFPCHDRRVRQALSYAIDKKLMGDKLFGGPEVMEVKGWWVVAPSTIGYSPELDPFPFDPVKARQLLAEAGYPGGQGFGKLVINYNVDVAITLLPESAQLGADMLRRELGLDVEVKVWDKTALSKTAGLTEDLHGQMTWKVQDTRLDARGIVRLFFLTGQEAGRPAKLHNDPELFAVVEKALGVFVDPVEEEKALNRAYRRLREEAYLFGFGYTNIPWGVGPRVQTWQPYPMTIYPSALHTISLK